jgi:hypothetical protein
MAGSGCQVVKHGDSEEIAGAAYRMTLKSKGIEPESTFKDSQIVDLSKVIFAAKCK